MGTSDATFEPHISMHVTYSYHNSPASEEQTKQRVTSIYMEDPWMDDGHAVPLSIWISEEQHDECYGEFRLVTSFPLGFDIKGSQMNAFETLAHRVAKTFTNQMKRWCTGGSISLDVDFTSSTGTNYYNLAQ